MVIILESSTLLNALDCPASIRMTYCADAANGVVPLPVAEDAEIDFWDAVVVGGVNAPMAAVAD